MDPSYRSPPKKGGSDAAGGSVRRAREHMMAGLPAENPSMPAQSRERFGDPRAAPSPPQNRNKAPPPASRGAPPTTRGVGQNIGMAISRPTPVAPQWPLGGPVASPQYETPQNRGPAPQRPPRPRNVPSMLDSSKIQEHTPAFQYQGQPAQNVDDELLSPDSRGLRPLTGSSVGTIPDFPVPSAAIPARRSANLGPPPSSRRGASSYYSQTSYVSPIPEESPRAHPNHGSYASSSAMPTMWGGEDSPAYEEDERIPDTIEEGRESRESNFSDPTDGEEKGLVRSVSIGRRAKANMVTTKSSEKLNEMPKNAQSATTTGAAGSNKLAKMGFFGAAEMKDAKSRPKNDVQQRDTRWPMQDGDLESPMSSVPGSASSNKTASSEAVPTLNRSNGDARFGKTDSPVGQASSTGTSNDESRQRIMDAHLAASNTSMGSGADRKEPERSWSRLSAIRRPPQLDINAVRDAEARGSMTSLPDLIRRATRLASMMDKGKRPGSRLDDLNGFADELAKEKEMGYEVEKRQSGLSGMLAAFPPPGLATPIRDAHSANLTPRPESRWPSPYEEKGLDGADRPRGADSKRPKPPRRCCGMRLWVALLLLLIVAIIATAGIVVPLKIFVLDKTAAASSSALETCQNNITCANGGTNTVSTGVCSCICVNGFLGSDCSVPGNSGCTTTSFTSGTTAYSNVTLGNAIPRLVAQGQANFSIPLFTETILAKFNAGGLSCDAQNALVTFDGLAMRYGSADSTVIPTISAAVTSGAAVPTSGSPQPNPDAKNAKRRDSGALGSAEELEVRGTEAGLVMTITAISTMIVSNSGILHDTTSTLLQTVTTNPTATNGAMSAATSSGAAAATSTSTPFVATQNNLDLARVVVLFILQQESLANAEVAETAIQSFLSSNVAITVATASNVSLGNGNSMNFIGGTVNIGNGNVGGMGASSAVPSTTAATRRRRYSPN